MKSNKLTTLEWVDCRLWQLSQKYSRALKEDRVQLGGQMKGFKSVRDYILKHPSNDDIIKRIMEWRGLSDAGLRLRCGEMTAQEIRTVRAVLNALL